MEKAGFADAHVAVGSKMGLRHVGGRYSVDQFFSLSISMIMIQGLIIFELFSFLILLLLLLPIFYI